MKNKITAIAFGVFASICLTGCVLTGNSSSSNMISSASTSSSANSAASTSSSSSGVISSSVSAGSVYNVPIYQGMTISRKSSSTALSARYKESYPDEGGYQEGGNPDGGHPDEGRPDDWHEPVYDDHDHHRHDHDIEKDIEDIVNIDVVTDEEVKYYVKPEETFTIDVHISNPDDYEIQSITIGGKKYANYMFTDGSTMEKIGITATAPKESGYTEYTVDAIKYIDGTQIKDVDLSKGDKTIRAGVSYLNPPSAEITSYEVGTTYINMGVAISDPERLIKDNPLAIYLTDGTDIIAEEELKLGDNRVRFTDLTMSTTYQYGIVTAYDFVDGKDTHEEWLLSKTFQTLGAYTINNVESSKTSINFSVDRTGEVGSIDKISLYDASSGELVEEGDSSTRSFEGLLSNHSYNLYVDFSYEVGGNSISDWVDYPNVATYAKIEPTLSFLSSSSDKTSVKYKISVEDLDAVLTVKKVELLRNGVAVKENGNALEGNFDKLLSGVSYSIKLNYSYNLNDGQGDISSFISKDISTVSKIAPSLTLSKPSSDKTSISYLISKEDIDGILSIDKVELLKGEETVQENTGALSGSFSGLLSGSPYSVKVSYSYDLNDGRGTIEDYVTADAKTASKIVPTLSFAPSSDKTSISYEIISNDIDGVMSIDKVELLKDGKTVKENNGELKGSFSSLLSGLSYEVKVSYSYDLNDGTGAIKDSVTQKLSTVAKLAPSIKFDSSSSDQSKIEYSLSVQDSDEILSIDKVELLKNGATEKENDGALSGSFSGLLSNNAYSIRVSYSYDLNDGSGVSTSSITENISTSAKSAPSVLISNDTTSDSSIKAALALEDEDSTGFINSVSLYKDGEFVSSNESKEISFSGLSSYTDYEVVVSYSYDLNDGKGIISKEFKKGYKTSPTLAFSSCKIGNTSAVSEGDTIYMQVSLNNPEGAIAKSAVINGRTYDCTSATTASKIFVEIVNDGQFEGGDTELVVEKVNVELDGQTYSILPLGSNKDSVFVNGILEVVELYAADANGERKELPYYFSNEDVYIGVELKNKTGYNVNKMTLTNLNYNVDEYSSFIKKDDNHWVVKMNDGAYQSDGSKVIALSQLSYSNDSVNKTLTISKSATIYLLNNDSPISVTSKEQLLNMNEGFHCYSLQNDISLNGEEWRGKELNGVFLGNDHTISDMSFIGTHKDSDISLGLFSSVYGLVDGIKIKDSTFIVDVQSSDRTSKFNVKSGFITGLLDSRSMISDCSIDSDSIMNISGSALSSSAFETGVGGIAGLIRGRIENCVNHGSISFSGTYVGGICGFLNPSSSINKCLNFGTVSGDGDVGGVVGYASDQNSISNCSNSGSISGSYYVGGVVGYIQWGSITNCDNTGSVDGKNEIGGVVGYSYSTPMKECENNGIVTGTYNVGGVVGSAGQQSSVSNCSNTGTVSGDEYVGGVVGYVYRGPITNCDNAGSVNGKYAIGGIVGYMSDQSSVSNCSNTGSATGTSYVGGIAGHKDNDCIIENCTNTGVVTINNK